jgi:hypothetical protein
MKTEVSAVVVYYSDKKRVYDSATFLKGSRTFIIEKVKKEAKSCGHRKINVFESDDSIMFSADSWDPPEYLKSQGYTFNRDASVFATVFLVQS